MILTIFRPKRTKDGKRHVSRSYRGRYRLDEADKLTDIPLHTTDKRVARERLERIVREKQLEAGGVLSPHRAALQTSLHKHLSDYLADLQAVGRDDQYIFDLNNRVCRLIRECHWGFLKEVSSDSFLAWRARQTLAPKTLNEYLASARSLFNWMVKHGRIERNPLALIQKVQSNGKQVRPRRAFTREEFQRLLAVAGPRKALYLTAVFTGLRRGELAALEWDDLDLDAERPFLKARASTTKNRKEAVIGLHRDVVAELRLIRSGRHAPNQRVFEGLMPRIKRFKADLKRANVEYINAKGQRADFHSLRYTLATNLAVAGTSPRAAMEIMRHSDMRLTTKTYTDAGLLAVWDKVANLPSFTTDCVIEDSQIDSQNSQIDSQNLVRTSPSVSIPVKENVKIGDLQPADKQHPKYDMSGPVTTSQENVDWSGRQDLNLRPRGPKPRALPS
jgi:integrase